MKVCERCGYNASPEAVYCIMCGKKLNSHSEDDNGVFGSIKSLLRGKMAEDELKA